MSDLPRGLCGEHFAHHPDKPYLVAVCTLPADHDGDHDNRLTTEAKP
jgi:hypothetical protein